MAGVLVGVRGLEGSGFDGLENGSSESDGAASDFLCLRELFFCFFCGEVKDSPFRFPAIPGNSAVKVSEENFCRDVTEDFVEARTIGLKLVDTH